MPVVQVSMKQGRTRDQKRELVARITQALAEVCGANPERVHVVIHDVAEDNWGHAGRLLSDGPAAAASGKTEQ